MLKLFMTFMKTILLLFKQREYLPSFLKRLLIPLVDYFEQKAARELDIIVAESYYLRGHSRAHIKLSYSGLDGGKKMGSPYLGLLYTGTVVEDRGLSLIQKLSLMPKVLRFGWLTSAIYCGFIS